MICIRWSQSNILCNKCFDLLKRCFHLNIPVENNIIMEIIVKKLQTIMKFITKFRIEVHWSNETHDFNFFDKLEKVFYGLHFLEWIGLFVLKPYSWPMYFTKRSMTKDFFRGYFSNFFIRNNMKLFDKLQHMWFGVWHE